MDAAQRFLCGDDLFTPLMAMGLQASLIFSVSHFLQLLLNPLGQPSPISQLLAGMLLGHSFLSRIKIIATYFFNSSAADYYQVMTFFGRVFIMFLIGLQLDVPFLWRNLRSICTLAYAGALLCIVFAGAISYPFYLYFGEQITLHNKWEHFPAFILVLMLSMANSASPIVFRFVAELNIGSSHFGRLVVCSSVVNDVTCLVLGAIVHKTGNPKGFNIGSWLGTFVVTALVSVVLRYLAAWLNGWHQNYKHIKDAQFVVVFFIILFTAGLTEIMGENSVLTSFLLGVAFPRQGKTTRTMANKLSYVVYNFVLPVYFGYIGFQANMLKLLGNVKDLVGISVVLVLSTVGKFVGTFAACQLLKLPSKKAVAVALFLTLKGHYDMLILSRAKNAADWSNEIYDIMLVVVLLKTLTAGVCVAFIVRRNPLTFGYNPIPLEQRTPESELRVLACVYGPRVVPTMIQLIKVLSWPTREMPIIAYLMHLIELLPKNDSSSKMYNQLQDDELSDDETYGGNEALEISDVVDTFVSETGIFINQLKAVSPLTRTYEDVRRGVEEVRASIIILPFHKHQRIDGKMESGKESLRMTNQKMLRQAPCTVAILVDRGLVSSMQAGPTKEQHVVVLFFGGPDDREALAFAKRIGMQVDVNVTLMRFVLDLPIESHEKINVSSDEDEEEVLVAMPSRGTEDEVDNAFLEEFYNRYVTSGKVGYVEKYVKNGAETATALREVADMYQLFILGKGGRRNASMTSGMSEWEECPELGTVGDLLAASDFVTNSSVLIIQQRTPISDSP